MCALPEKEHEIPAKKSSSNYAANQRVSIQAAGYFGVTIEYLAGKPDFPDYAARFLFMNEVDKYPGASSRESAPSSLARKRTKTFTNSKKMFITSTLAITTDHVWKSLQGCDVGKR